MQTRCVYLEQLIHVVTDIIVCQLLVKLLWDNMKTSVYKLFRTIISFMSAALYTCTTLTGGLCVLLIMDINAYAWMATLLVVQLV